MMKKEDCRKGMVVLFGEDNCRGVIVKINPKLARVSTLDSHKGKRPGLVWRVPYSMLSPVIGNQVGTEMAMRSFASPDDVAVKTWASHRPNTDIPRKLEEEDYHILAAIHILYTKLERLDGRDRIHASSKIHLMFRAIGQEVSKESVEKWMLERAGK
jgi:hypothetical protein